MRIWDVDPRRLCRTHLFAEHREVHAVWAILTEEKTGYARHPEVLRWQGKLAGLHARHEALVAEIARRGYRHASPLDAALASGDSRQDELLVSAEEQLALLSGKWCECPLAE